MDVYEYIIDYKCNESLYYMNTCTSEDKKIF